MLNAEATIPVEISRINENGLQVKWKDGHISRFGGRYLRVHCTCASCAEEKTGRPLLNPDTVPVNIYPQANEPVGRYGIRITWESGHNTGIYHFRRLRELCPCDACAAPGT